MKFGERIVDDSAGISVFVELLFLAVFSFEGEVAAAVAVIVVLVYGDGFGAGVAVELILTVWGEMYMER